MEILRDISILWAMVHTLIMFMFLFESRYEKKKTMYITLGTMIPLIIVNLLLFVKIGFEGYSTLMLVSLSLPSCIVFWFLSKYRDGRFFFTFCMIDTTVLEIVYITNILDFYTTNESHLVMFLVRLIVLPLIEIVIRKKLRPVYLDVQSRTSKGWGIFAVIGVLFYVAITLQMSYPDSVTNRPEQIPALVLMFILMPVIYLHIISTLRRYQHTFEKAEEENLMKVQTANILERVDELSAANDKFREERHNFRHKLKTIASLVEDGEYEELRILISEYRENIDKTRVIKYCQHSVLDAVLSVYINKAKRADIDLTLGFDFPDTFAVKESELATALANAIENAIHASMKLPKEKRKITIKVIRKPQFMIMVRNNFAGEVTFNEKGLPVSQSGDGHGLGTKSMVSLCNKLGGFCDFKAENGVFTVFMTLK
ncbi:MAG: GHKL domain-containing protein [Ruminococcaceae bacterium]|nr:GHKL domain-containing protein [Oscillospiraceae bacterium]